MSHLPFTEPIPELQDLQTNLSINYMNYRRANLVHLMTKRIVTSQIIQYEINLGSRYITIQNTDGIKESHFETYTTPFNPFLQSIEIGETINSIAKTQLYSSRSLMTAQNDEKFVILDGIDTSFASVQTGDNKESNYLSSAIDSLVIKDTLLYYDKSIAYNGGKSPANLQGTPSSLWNGGCFSSMQIFNPVLRYIAENPNAYDHQLPNCYTSPKHEENSGSYYPRVIEDISANNFDLITEPAISMKGHRNNKSFSFEKFDFRYIEKNDYIVTDTSYKGTNVYGYKVPMGFYVSHSHVNAFTGIAENGPIKYVSSSFFDKRGSICDGYYYHLEKSSTTAAGATNLSYNTVVNLLDDKMRDTMPGWHNLIGDTYSDSTEEITANETPGFFTKTGKKTVTSDKPADTVIIVQDPTDGTTEPFVDFIDTFRPNRARPISSQVLPPPNFGPA